MSDEVFREDWSQIDNTCPCMFGFIMDGEDDAACTPCESNCESCVDTLTTCTSCFAGTYLTGTAEC